jgi:hypothetical protein
MQLPLFPSDQALWDDALVALEELDVDAALARLAVRANLGTDRPDLAAMRDALAHLSATGLGPQSGPAALSSALWALPTCARASGLSPAAASKALEALARRIVSLAGRQPPGSTLFEPAALARAHLLLRQELKAGEALRRNANSRSASAAEHFAWADLWASQGHEDAGFAYGRGLALDPRAFESSWTSSERLRALHEELAREFGTDEARDRLLAEAWWRGIVELPRADPDWSERCRRELAGPNGAAMGGSRKFSLLLAEDVASTAALLERRDALDELDGELFKRVLERLKRLTPAKA